LALASETTVTERNCHEADLCLLVRFARATDGGAGIGSVAGDTKAGALIGGGIGLLYDPL
jgi:hypothetical protein